MLGCQRRCAAFLRVVFDGCRRQRGAANYLLFRRKTRDQTQAVLSLETKVTELTSDLELLRTHRAQSASRKSPASGGGPDSRQGSDFGSDEAELHIAGEVQVNLSLCERACVRARVVFWSAHRDK